MRKLSKRQKAYRVYLQSDHWKALRQRAIDRDGGKCVRCSSVDILQVHHLCYRGHLEDALIEDLETVCRECHRKEHGFGPSDFELKFRELEALLNHDVIPDDAKLAELVAGAVWQDDQRRVESFFRLMANVRIGSEERWTSWLSKSKEIRIRLWPWARSKFLRMRAGLPALLE